MNGALLSATHLALSPYFSEQVSKVGKSYHSGFLAANDRNHLWVILAGKQFIQRILGISEVYRECPENGQHPGEARSWVQIMVANAVTEGHMPGAATTPE